MKVRVVALALLASGCCLGGSGGAIGDRCDPSAFVPRCTATGYTSCSPGNVFGGSMTVTEIACMPRDRCLPVGGSVGCVAEPARTCDPASFVARCDADSPVVCDFASTYVTGTYESHAAACGSAGCVVRDGHARCGP